MNFLAKAVLGALAFFAITADSTPAAILALTVAMMLERKQSEPVHALHVTMIINASTGG